MKKSKSKFFKPIESKGDLDAVFYLLFNLERCLEKRIKFDKSSNFMKEIYSSLCCLDLEWCLFEECPTYKLYRLYSELDKNLDEYRRRDVIKKS